MKNGWRMVGVGVGRFGPLSPVSPSNIYEDASTADSHNCERFLLGLFHDGRRQAGGEPTATGASARMKQSSSGSSPSAETAAWQQPGSAKRLGGAATAWSDGSSHLPSGSSSSLGAGIWRAIKEALRGGDCQRCCCCFCFFPLPFFPFFEAQEGEHRCGCNEDTARRVFFF